MENTNAKKRKRLSPILLIFIILAALTAALVCAVLIIWLSGRASLSGKEAKAPMLVEVPASAEPDENGGIAAPTPAPTPVITPHKVQTLPQTGDGFPLLAIVVVSLASATGIVLLTVKQSCK